MTLISSNESNEIFVCNFSQEMFLVCMFCHARRTTIICVQYLHRIREVLLQSIYISFILSWIYELRQFINSLIENQRTLICMYQFMIFRCAFLIFRLSDIFAHIFGKDVMHLGNHPSYQNTCSIFVLQNVFRVKAFSICEAQSKTTKWSIFHSP